MKRTRAVKRVNAKRAKAKHERNFAGPKLVNRPDKDDWIRGFPCDVSGLVPVEAAHVLGNRGMGGAGGDYRGLVPLHASVHRDFDGTALPYLDDEAFLAKHKRTRESIRERASYYNEMWESWPAVRGPEDLTF